MTFHKYTVQLRFHAAELKTYLEIGDIIEYDGTNCRRGDSIIPYPLLRSAIGRGWLVAEGAEQVPVVAATPKYATVHESAREVGTVQANNERRAAAENPGTPKMASALGNEVAEVGKVRPALAGVLQKVREYLNTLPAGVRLAEVMGGLPKPQNAEEADQINATLLEWAKNQPVAKPNREDGVVPGTRHNTVGDVSAGGGAGTKKYAVVSVDGGGSQGVEIGRIKSTGLATVGREDARDRGRGTDVSGMSDPEALVESRQVPIGGLTTKVILTDPGIGEFEAVPVRPKAFDLDANSQGVQAIHKNGAVGDVDSPMEGEDLSELLPDAAIAGKQGFVPPPVKAAPSVAPEVRAARQKAAAAKLAAEWDTTRPWAERVAEAVEFYGNSPDMIDAICSVESPGVVKRIMAGLGMAVDEAPAPAPAPTAVVDSPAKRKPGRPRKVA